MLNHEYSFSLVNKSGLSMLSFPFAFHKCSCYWVDEAEEGAMTTSGKEPGLGRWKHGWFRLGRAALSALSPILVHEFSDRNIGQKSDLHVNTAEYLPQRNITFITALIYHRYLIQQLHSPAWGTQNIKCIYICEHIYPCKNIPFLCMRISVYVHIHSVCMSVYSYMCMSVYIHTHTYEYRDTLQLKWQSLNI